MSPNDLARLALIGLAGCVAAAINAVAGGGSLVSFPALMGLGVPSVPANATNAFGLIPGSLSGALGLHDRFNKTKALLAELMLASFVGGGAGAWLLWQTPGKTFDRLVPFLTLTATGLLFAQPWLKAWRDRRVRKSGRAWGFVIQLVMSVYGGYFGAGIGIMMLAAFGLFVDADIHEQNALKGWLAVGINVVASIQFALLGLIRYPEAGALMVGAIIGGYMAGRASKNFNADKLRGAIVVYGVVMSSILAYKAYT